MLTCSKCGTENPLGRVFCTKCGTKLDLGRVKKEDLDSQIKVNWFVRNVRKIIWVIVVLIIIPVVLALWPNTQPLGNTGQKQDERYVDRCLKEMGKLRHGQIMPNVQFSDAQINALFAEGRAKEWHVDMVNFGLQQGYFTIRMVSPLVGPLTVGRYQIGLKLSRDITCVPMGGARVEVRKAALGHLPLPSFLKSLAANSIIKKAMADPDWSGLSGISEIKCEPKKITVTIKP